MRRQDDVVEPDQRIVEREWLDLEDVEAGAGDPAIAQRGHERLLIDQLAPADVDEVGGWLHQGQLRRADQSAGRLGEPAVQADEVRLAQDLFQRSRGVRPATGRPPGRRGAR